jgi:flagellar motor switch protein FliM
MTDPVLSEEEKGALLEGISNGEVEVHSSRGPSYASVTPFEIAARSRIVSNSYPRMQSLNRQFAGRMGKQSEVLLNADSTMTFEHIEKSTYSEFCERFNSLSLVVEFSPKPLQGSALIHLNTELVETLVETFYGGVGNESDRPEADFFTPGEINVASLFCKAILTTISEVWQPLQDLSISLEGTHLSSGVIDSIDGADSVIAAEFKIQIGDKEQLLHIVWPVTTVAPLLPVFEGQKRERDAAEDARWETSLRSRIVDSNIKITSGVGRTRMKLGEVARMVPGDVFNISSPRSGTVYAQSVPVLKGRFGINDGRHAMEATEWIASGSTNGTKPN